MIRVLLHYSPKSFGDGAWRYTLPLLGRIYHIFAGLIHRMLQDCNIHLRCWRSIDSSRASGNDGDGKWVNLKAYAPSQLSRLKKSRTITGSTSVVYFMNHTGKTVSVYRVEPEGKEVFWRNVTPLKLGISGCLTEVSS